MTAIQDRRRLPPPFDIAVAMVLVASMLAITLGRLPDGDGREVDALGVVLIVIACGSIAWRRVAPEVVVGVTTLAVLAYNLLDFIGGPVYLTPIIAIFSVASVEGRRRAVPVAAVVTVVLVGSGMIEGASRESLLAHLLYGSWLIGAALAGQVLLSRRAHMAGLEERARYLEETRDEEARRQVAEERLRIARDLHDIVAHNLASIHIQAGAGAHVIDRHPDEARDALVAIKQASKEALDELRVTLGMLREGEEGAPLAPAPGLADLDALVAGAERAGLPVEVQVRGVVGHLPPALDLSAYRIVQESLTNVMRHAGPARATVRVTYAADAIEVEVTDDGTGSVSDGDAVGHGIAGMRERASMVGGRVEAGPRAGGGFRVWASLPVEAVLR